MIAFCLCRVDDSTVYENYNAHALIVQPGVACNSGQLNGQLENARAKRTNTAMYSS